MDEVYSPDNIELSEEAKVAFFLGAGASIPAGLSSVVGLVSEFRNWLQSENKTNQLELTDRIISTIRNWKQDSGDKTEVDIELLLETIEKIEKRDRDVLPLFYEKNTFSLSDCRGYELISDGKAPLSEEIKRFIKLSLQKRRLK